jgi:hypothetical protein
MMKLMIVLFCRVCDISLVTGFLYVDKNDSQEEKSPLDSCRTCNHMGRGASNEKSAIANLIPIPIPAPSHTKSSPNARAARLAILQIGATPPSPID